MKGNIIIYGVEYKFKTKYYATHEMILNSRNIDLLYKQKGKLLYRTVKLISNPTWYYEPLKEEFDKQVKSFDDFLTMTDEELRNKIANRITRDIDERKCNKEEEVEDKIKEKAFNRTFNR